MISCTSDRTFATFSSIDDLAAPYARLRRSPWVCVSARTQTHALIVDHLMETTRCAVQVFAGVLPGTPEPEFTKTWVIQSDEWHAEGADQGMLLCELAGKACGYATYLMLQPDRYNWVKTEWIWF